MLNWIIENKEWIFSGIGITLIFVFITSLKYFVTTVKNRKTIINDEKKIKSSDDILLEKQSQSVISPEQLSLEEILNQQDYKIKSLTDQQLNIKVGEKFVDIDLTEMILKLPKIKRKLKTIIFIDIDDLTLINKHFGEKVGDYVLKVVAGILNAPDSVKYFGRCGEDTFYQMLYKGTDENAEKICNRLLKKIRSFPWNKLASELRVTCTFGYATLNPDEDPSEWLERAINGLLDGKKNGGNTVNSGPLFSGKTFYSKRKHRIYKKSRFSIRAHVS